MGYSKKALLSAFVLATSGILQAADSAGDAIPVYSKPDISALVDPAIRLVLRDSRQHLSCYESSSGFACVSSTVDTAPVLSAADDIGVDGKVIVQTAVDKDNGILCYTNSAGLWCGKSQSKEGKKAYAVDTAVLGDLGPVYRIRDMANNLAVYTNQHGISGATPEKFNRRDEVQVVNFERVTVQRIRDYNVGLTCYLAPQAQKSFACMPLHEDRISGTDQRGIYKVNDPELRYSIIDQSSDSALINVSDYAVCITSRVGVDKPDDRLEIRKVDTLDGRKVVRIVDELMGGVTYSAEKGMSCSPLVAKTPSPSP